MSYHTVVRMMMPVIVAQAFILGYAAASPVLVAGAGTAAVDAVSTVGYLNVFLLSVYLAFASAGSVVVAHHAGHGDHDAVRSAAGVTLWVSLVPAALTCVGLLVAAQPLARALLGPAGAQTVEFAHVYLIGLAVSYPAQAMVDGVSSALRGMARTTPALWLTIVGNGVFLLTAFLLATVAGLGVWGLAVGGVVGSYIAAALAVWFIQREPDFAGRGPRWWPVEPPMLRRIAGLGIPFVVEQLFFNGGKLVIQLFIVGMGTLAITANAVINSLAAFSEVLPQALCVGLIPIVGQSLGAGQPDDARRITRSFGVAVDLTAVVGCGPILLALPWLLNLYHTPDAVRHEVFVIFLLITSARLVGLWSWSWLVPSSLRAAGDAVYTTAVATVAMAFRVSCIWLVGVRLGYGVMGVWVVMVAEWALRSALYWWRFRGQMWLQHSPVRTAHAESVPA